MHLPRICNLGCPCLYRCKNHRRDHYLGVEETRIFVDCLEMSMDNQLVYSHMLKCLDRGNWRKPWRGIHLHEIVVVAAVDVAVGQKIDQKMLKTVK